MPSGNRQTASPRERASIKWVMASVLSTAESSGKSFLRLIGTVPADSISQLVNVLWPNWVDLAVKRSIERTLDGIDATSNTASVSELLWLAATMLYSNHNRV
jgi:hypothetical protein